MDDQIDVARPKMDHLTFLIDHHWEFCEVDGAYSPFLLPTPTQLCFSKYRFT